MLPRRHRLRSPRDFAGCYRRGERASDALLGVALRHRPIGPSRLGVSVSQKVGRSVVRNRVKRWIRAAARDLLTRDGPPFDLVVTARPAAAEAGFSAVRRSLLGLVARAGRRGSE